MDPDMSASVIRSFVDLYNKGLIYGDTDGSGILSKNYFV
jgi:valyl-tRNA synthetase